MSETLRRQPAQRRGAERVDLLLDACGELLDEVGYDALTTRAVARRAKSSIGSYYQFFGSKTSLVRAFGQRNLDRYLARVTSRLEAAPPARWPDLLDVVLDEYVAMRRSVPGFGVVDFALVGAGDASERVADHLMELIARYHCRQDGADLRRALRVSVETADALVRLAFRTGAPGDPRLLVEAKLVISGYLARYLGPA